jgi:hypothetical protein
MDDKGLDLKFYQDAYNAKVKQVDMLQAELVKLNSSLATSRAGKRGGIRQAIKNLEQQISKAVIDMRKTQENLTEQTLALQGIDQDSNKLGAVSDIVGGIAQTAGSIMGAGGLSGIASAKQETEQVRVQEIGKVEQEKVKGKASNTNIIYIVVGAVVLLMMMKKK